jgi:hypothetical protein
MTKVAEAGSSLRSVFRHPRRFVKQNETRGLRRL